MANIITLPDGNTITSDQLIQAIAESNDPTIDLSSIENKLDLTYSALISLEARLTHIEEKLANLPTEWTIS